MTKEPNVMTMKTQVTFQFADLAVGVSKDMTIGNSTKKLDSLNAKTNIMPEYKYKQNNFHNKTQTNMCCKCILSKPYAFIAKSLRIQLCTVLNAKADVLVNYQTSYT